MKLIILGPAGAGKGTQSEFISGRYRLAHISTGDIFRRNLSEGTPLGLEAKTYMEAGVLVPDSLTIAMVMDRIGQKDCEEGYLLDGFPRSASQAGSLEEAGEKIDCAINIEASYPLLIKRIIGRRVCPSCSTAYHIETRKPKVEGVCDKCGAALVHRPDDTEETVTTRFKEYEEKTKPLAEFYKAKGILRVIDGDQPIEKVSSDIAEILDAI